jgi:hypothetical protein
LAQFGEVWLIVVWATVEDVQAHAGPAKLRRQAKTELLAI